MKSVLPALSLVVLLASCTTAYKTGHTPDDVYFSPQRPQDEYVRVEEKRDRYRYDEQTEDDRYLRMKVRNRRMWSDLDYYYSDPFAYRYYNSYNSIAPAYFYSNPWSYYNSWNHLYNPYATGVIILNPKSPTYNRPRTTNLNVYNPNTINTGISTDRHISPGKTRVFGNTSSDGNSSPRRTNVGSELRNIFNSSTSNNSNSSPNNAPVRTQSSSSNTSSSSSSSSGSTNAPVRKF